jgi:hypothetical protein
VGFGLVLLSDLARRWVEIDFWYTNRGLLPNHTVLWRPPAPRTFSLFFGVSNADEAHFGFALCGLVYLAFLLGYRARLVQVLALLARVSLNTRLAVLENGGDMVMDLLCLLTLPLPLGARFSLDAVGRARRDRKLGKSSDPWLRQPVHSIAVLALLLQFSIVYLFNAAAKNGEAWRDGTAVYYALHLDKHATALGVWMREELPLSAIRGLSWSVLGTEWLGFALIISPFFLRATRLLAVFVLPPLHLGFALGLNLGGFSPAMMAFFPLLLRAEHWDWLERRWGPALAPARDRAVAVAESFLARVRHRPEGPISVWRRSFLETATLVVLVAIVLEVLNDNTPVPKALRLHQPQWAKAVIEYPRILQGWRMFAPDPPRIDSMIHVDATTAAGERVDPYNEVASAQKFPSGRVVPAHMDQSQFFVMYSDRIPNVNYGAYRQAFSEWLLDYPRRTGRKEDCLVEYEVYYVSDRTPPPGTTADPTPLERTSFMSYRVPHDGPCQPLRSKRESPPVASQ